MVSMVAHMFCCPDVAQVLPVCQLWLPQPPWEAPSLDGNITAACVPV